jgi:FkbM family methyltransferase
MNIIEKLKTILDKSNPIVLEIGCANGLDSLRFLNQFKDIKLFCFEPDPRNIDIFKKQINDNRCKLFEIAIGSENKEIDFHQSSGQPSSEPIGTDCALSGSLQKPKDHLTGHPWCKFNKIIKVQCQKLDTWIRENNINFIDLIWADVNGAERNLIEGGKEAFGVTQYIYIQNLVQKI